MDQHNTTHDRTADDLSQDAQKTNPWNLARGTSMRHNTLIFLVSTPEIVPPQSPSLPPPTAQAETFPLPRYNAPMYPPHVSDLQIQHLIGELTVGNRLPSGAELRTTLKKRFGSRGGVARVYRLLTRARAATRPPSHPPADLQKLERELNALRESATLSQHREEAHQTRWALEVDRLRQRLIELEPLALHAKAALDNAELLRRQLHAAHMRISVLEQQLLESSPNSSR